ncbi:hypothetical protein FS320_43045, partial [Microvirga tunisiensis]|nr:hypothetical protein [Microvirga tunisiensis]
MARPTRVPATTDPTIDGVLGGTKWVGTVSYSFPDSRSDYEFFYPIPVEIIAPTASNGPFAIPLARSNFTRAHPLQEEAVHHILKGFWAGSEVTDPRSAHVHTMAVEEFTTLKFRYGGRDEEDIRIAQS